MFNTVIFDLDGTLLYTLDDLAKSTNFALSKFGYPEHKTSEVRQFVGNGSRKLIERALPSPLSDHEVDAILEVFKTHYSVNMFNKTRPYVGTERMLQSLKSKGIKTAVVSNKFDSAVKKLCEKCFGTLIDASAGESPECRKKPAPDGLFCVAEQLGSLISSCVYVGDSEVDIETAKNAGMACISVDWGYKERDFLIAHGAQKIISTPLELLYALGN